MKKLFQEIGKIRYPTVFHLVIKVSAHEFQPEDLHFDKREGNQVP